MHPADDASAVAIRQIKAFVHTLPADELSTPVFVFDAGYDPVALALGLETTPTAILVRLRSNRCFYADPGGYIGNGRPRRHGAKFVCTDAATWPEPTSEHTCDDPGYGQVRVRAWAGLHSVVKVHRSRRLPQASPHRSGHRRPRRGCPLAGTDTQATDALALLARPGQAGSEHCLAGIHPSFGYPLGARAHHQVQQADTGYPRSGCGTMPRLRLPEQADSWSWLVLAAYTQLRLARPWVQDKRLPWQRRLESNKITPYRVRRAFSSVLSVLGTPASGPKPCGRSPGRPKGCRFGPAALHPVLKKSA